MIYDDKGNKNKSIKTCKTHHYDSSHTFLNNKKKIELTFINLGTWKQPNFSLIKRYEIFAIWNLVDSYILEKRLLCYKQLKFKFLV